MFSLGAPEWAWMKQPFKVPLKSRHSQGSKSFIVSRAITHGFVKRQKYQTLEKLDPLLVLPLHVRQILILKSFSGGKICINYGCTIDTA